MAAKKNYKIKPEEAQPAAQKPRSAEPGHAPSEAAASQSPALALQAHLHTSTKPHVLDFMSRFTTLLFALTLFGTWLATEAAYTTL